MLLSTTASSLRQGTRSISQASFKASVIGLTAHRSFSTTRAQCKQKLVILGSGWGGYELMRKVDKRSYDVVMVSPNTYFAMTPLLASTAVGTLEFRCALEPVRRYSNVVAFQAAARRIDLEKKQVECTPAVGGSKSANSESPRPFNLDYDLLAISVGCYSQTFNTPGVKEHAHFLKDVKDARRIRTRILECFELAAQPTLTDVERQNVLHFVIVGGGPTGIEFAAELHDLIASDMVRHYPRLSRIARITIYDVAPTILGAFDKSLVDFALEQFGRQGVRIKNQRHVVKVNESSIEIKEEGTGERVLSEAERSIRTNFGQQSIAVPCGMVVWSTGLAPNPLIDSLKELKHDEKTHSLQVDGHFHPSTVDGKKLDDVFVIGDAAMLKEKLPATAQVANQEARHLARILNAQVRGFEPPGDFEFVNQGIMTYIGNWNALFDRSGAKKDGFKEGGRFAWLIWRSAYWTQAMSWRNKFSLAFFWFLNWIFGRSITRF